MLTVTGAQLVLEVLDEKTKGQDVFTAFDVTMAVREKTNDRITHNDVKTIVSDQFVTGQMDSAYDREIKPLTISTVVDPFVYFPDTKCSEDHPLVDGVGSTDNSVGGGTDSCGGSTDSVDDSTDDPDVHKLTAEGRVNIPKDMLAKVSPSCGSYDILVSGSLKCVAPNKDGRVRIGVRNFGIVGSKVSITVDAGKNCIEIVNA